MEITAELIRELSVLAALELDAGESERMKRDLAAILGYVEQLAELDLDGVPPTSHVLDVATPLRPDEVRGVLPVEAAIGSSPRHDASSMIVPKVIE